MIRSILFLLILLLCQIGAYAQVSGNVLYNPETRNNFQYQQSLAVLNVSNMNELTISVNAMQNEYADSYVAIFHVTQVGASAREADSLLNLRIQRLSADAKAIGIPKEDIVIDMLSMVPVYEIEVTKKLFSKTYNEIPAGFEIKKNIHIGYKDHNDLDKLITYAAFNEIYDLVKVDYFVNNVDLVYANLRTKAVELINDKIAEFEKIGIPLKGQWRMAVDTKGVHYPLDRYQQYTTKSRPSFQAANKRATLIEMPAPVTLFYNKLGYNDFDIVVNPEVIEPAVQYTYSISVKFQVIKEEKGKDKAPEPVKEIQNRYFIINEQGNPVELPIK